MPSIPVYDSSQNISSQPAGVPRDIAAQPFNDMQQVAGTLTKVTQGLSDANDVIQATQAQTTHMVALAQAKKAAALDPDPNNAEAHIKAINDLTDTATDGIANKEVANHIGLELQQQSFLAQIQIQDDFRKKQMLQNGINLTQSASVAAQNVSSAPSDAAKLQIDQDFLQQINRNYSAGLITEGQANSLIDNYRMGIVKNDIIKEGAMNVGDSSVLKEVNKGVNGSYPNLTTDQRTEADRMVRVNVSDNIKAGIGQTLNTRISTFKGMASGDLSWQNPDVINQITAKDPKLGEALQDVITAQERHEDYTPKKEDQNYADSVERIFKAKNQQEISDFLVNTVRSSGREMSVDRLAILVNAVDARAKNLKTTDPTFRTPEQIVIDGGMDAVQRWNKNNGNNDPQVLDDYMKSIQSGSSAHDAYNAAIKTKIVKDHPEVGAQKDVPNRIINNDSSFHIFTGATNIYPARIWNERLGRFEINPNREKSNDNSVK